MNVESHQICRAGLITKAEADELLAWLESQGYRRKFEEGWPLQPGWCEMEPFVTDDRGVEYEVRWISHKRFWQWAGTVADYAAEWMLELSDLP